jgi:hypothetical protein
MTVLPEIKLVGYEKKERLFTLFINHVQIGFLDPKLTFLIDKVNFNLSEYVNSQNNGYCRYWSSENPHDLIQLPLTTRR